MDHIVYVDAKAKELEKILNHGKSMIIRGAGGRKLPHGKVFAGDWLFFIQNNGEGMVRALAKVKSVLNSEKLTEDESLSLVSSHQHLLQLSPDQFERWAGKRYLVLIEIESISPCEPFSIDRSAYGNMDDWLPVGDIALIKR